MKDGEVIAGCIRPTPDVDGSEAEQDGVGDGCFPSEKYRHMAYRERTGDTGTWKSRKRNNIMMTG